MALTIRQTIVHITNRIIILIPEGDPHKTKTKIKITQECLEI
jgi:hypothetical protein